MLKNLVNAIKRRVVCLVVNRGALVLGKTLENVLARAEMLEALAKYHAISLQFGGPVLLSGEDVQKALDANAQYKFDAD